MTPITLVKQPSVKRQHPRLVAGRYCVGLVAARDIEAGEEASPVHNNQFGNSHTPIMVNRMEQKV